MKRDGQKRPVVASRRRRGSISTIALLLAMLMYIFQPSGVARAAVRAGVKSGGDTVRAVLKNGLRVVIVPNSLAPVATIVVNYLVGSIDVPPEFPGMAHAQEHMMFRGSPGLSADQLAAVTAALGGNFNADTQQTATQYFFTVPVEDLETALRVEALRMRGVIDSDADWDQERGAIEQEVAQDLSIPEYVFYSRLTAAMFKGTPYAHTPLGTKESFDQTTGAMLRRFYRTWYAPNNAILVITGAVNPKKVLGQVQRLFEGIPVKTLPERRPIHLEPVKPDTLHLATDRSNGLAVVAFRMPGYKSPQFAATQVLADLLNSKRGELYALVTQGQALSVEFTLDALPEASIGYAAATFPKGASGDALLEQLWAKIRDQVHGGLTPDLVQSAQRHAVTESEMQKSSVLGMAMHWSQALAVEGRQSPRQDLDAIQSVTVKDVTAVARKYLDPHRTVRAVLTPEPSSAPSAANATPRVESFTRQPAENVQLPDWAQPSLARLKVPDFQAQPDERILSNGIRLIVQPESVSRVVSIFGHVHNIPSLTEPKGREGVDQVLDQLFSYGTTSLNRIDFQKALDKIGASESAGTAFSLFVLKTYLDQGVKLLADHVLHPALPPEAFDTVRQQVAAAAAGELQSPDYLFHRSLRKALFPAGDPTLRQTTPVSVDAVTLKDVRDYYDKVFRPDLTTLVVVGPITPAEAEALVSKYFGSWQAKGRRPQIALPPVPSNAAGTVHVPDDKRVQEKVVLSETLGMTRSNADYYALQLGNHVLGGGFYATRLYRDLRENKGLVYFVSSSFDIDRTRGIYRVFYACDPANVDATQAIVHQNLTEMQTEPVTPRELQLAKAMAIKEIPLAEASTDLIAQGLISRVELGLPLQEPARAARRYLSLNAEQVKTAFAKWLRPEDLVQVTEGPKPK